MTELLITYIILWVVTIFFGRLILPWMLRTNRIIFIQEEHFKYNRLVMDKILAELEKLNNKSKQ